MNPSAQATGRPLQTAIDLDTFFQLAVEGVDLREHVLTCLYGRDPRPSHPILTAELYPLGWLTRGVRVTDPCVVFTCEVAA